MCRRDVNRSYETSWTSVTSVREHVSLPLCNSVSKPVCLLFGPCGSRCGGGTFGPATAMAVSYQRSFTRQLLALICQLLSFHVDFNQGC